MPEMPEANIYTPELAESVLGSQNKLSDNDIEKISDTLESANSPDVKDIRDYKDSVEVDPDAELVSATTDVPEDPNPIDLIAADFEKDMADESIYENADPLDDEKAVEKTAEKAKDEFNLSNEEALELLQTLEHMKKDPKYPVFYHIPEQMKAIVRELATGANIGANHYNEIARMVLSEMVGDVGLQNAMIDLEDSLNKALAIPSISDLYSEHTRDVMEVHIPETIEKIKDEYPDKAEALQKVKEAFTASYTFSFAKEEYLNNSRIRKAVRREDIELKRALSDFNGMNEKSKFKMNDVSELPEVLYNVLINQFNDSKFMPEYAERNLKYHLHPESYQEDLNAEKEEHKDDEEEWTSTIKPRNKNIVWIPFYTKDKDGKESFAGFLDLRTLSENSEDFNPEFVKLRLITDTDINKFCVLISKSCMNKNPLSVIDASYMYYMMRNILMLKHTQEAKTDFAAELISNIIECISFITNEEAKFYADNKQHTRPKQLHSSRSSKSRG